MLQPLQIVVVSMQRAEELLKDSSVALLVNPLPTGLDLSPLHGGLPLLSPKLLGLFSKFKRRLIALPKLSKET